jgi:hypothetical protein
MELLEGTGIYPVLPTEEQTEETAIENIVEGLTRRQRLRRRQNERRRRGRDLEREIELFNEEHRQQRILNAQNDPDHHELTEPHYDLIRQHMRENENPGEPEWGNDPAWEPDWTPDQTPPPPVQRRGRRRRRIETNTDSNPSTQIQRGRTNPFTSRCWQRSGVVTESTYVSVSSTATHQATIPSQNIAGDSNSSSERPFEQRPGFLPALRLIKCCLLMILGMYLFMCTPTTSAASTSEPLLFEYVGDVVTGLSYVHSIIPVDIAGFEKHLVEYQSTLEKEFETDTLERTHRDFVATIKAKSKVDKATSSLNFDRSMSCSSIKSFEAFKSYLFR